MRTKTLALSAMLGLLGSASVMAQANVYSLNAVGYINVTLPVGFSIVACPLIVSGGNTVANLFNNLGGSYQYSTIYAYINGTGFATADSAGQYSGGTAGWVNNGIETLNPGQAVFYFNGAATNQTVTFVGTVPQGLLTNQLVPGFNLVGSMVPTSGDLVTNTIMAAASAETGGGFGPNGPGQLDTIYIFDSSYTGSQQNGYETANSYGQGIGGWLNGDPVITNVFEGFFYYNANYTGAVGAAANVNWIENFSINP